MAEHVFRGGVTFPEYGGVVLEGDPGTVPPNRFRDAVNVRLNGGEVDDRGGQSKLDPNGEALDGCIVGIFPADYEPTGPFLHMRSAVGWADRNALWKYDVGAAVGGLTYTGVLIDTLSPLDVAYAVDGGVLFGGRNGRVYMVAGGAVTLFHTLALGDTMRVTGIAKIGGTYYFAVADTALVAANAKIYSWDGEAATATVDNSPGLAGAIGLAVLGSELFAYWSEGVNFTPSTVNTVRKRTAGGSWSTLTFPGGITDGLVYDAEVFNSKLYFAGKGNPGTGEQAYIFLYDPAAPTVVSVINGPFGATVAKCTRVLTFNSLLKYLWVEDPAGADNHVAYLGSYNGTTFSNTEKNFVTQFFPGQRPRRAYGIAQFQSNLYAMIETQDSGSGQGAMLIRSPGTNTAGTWDTLEANPTSTYEYFGADFQHGMGMQL